MEHFDLVVIGGGPAGEKGAAQAAYFGKRVAIVEKEPHLGGAGLNTGTVPSKTLRESALYYSGLRQRDLYGINYSLREGLRVEDFLYRKDRVLETGWRVLEANVARHRIEVFHGGASFEDPHTVRVDGDGGPRLLHGQVILIATGSAPFHPPGLEFSDPRILDSDTVLRMDRIPASLVVLGGGVIGCEYASIFRALGSEVTIVDPRDRLLSFLDAEISERLALQWSLQGMKVLHNETFQEVDAPPDPAAPVTLRMRSGRRVTAEKILVALGRSGQSDGLRLDRAGLSPGKRGVIAVDRDFCTGVPHIYAAGDVIGFPALASVSMEQGRVAMCHAFRLEYKDHVTSLLPMGIYTIPEISGVGETEESARDKGIEVVVGRGYYERNARGVIIGDSQGIVKLLFERSTQRLVGVHCLGDGATELVHIGMAVLQCKGGIPDFVEMVFNVPTLSDLYKYAAYEALGALQAGS